MNKAKKNIVVVGFTKEERNSLAWFSSTYSSLAKTQVSLKPPAIWSCDVPWHTA